MAHDAKVAVLGTGIMGAAMARNLLSAGMEVRAWNRSREKAEPLAEVAGNPADRRGRRGPLRRGDRGGARLGGPGRRLPGCGAGA